MTWTNERAIRQWASTPLDAMEDTALDGDFAKRHVLNPTLLRLLGDVRGRRVLDAGCGNGYLSRMLAGRGAGVVGVEPAKALYEYAATRGTPGVRYVQADLCARPDLGEPFDLVVSSMVLQSIPDWIGAMRACVDALKPGGLFVFTLNHPCFENLWTVWREHGDYRLTRYLTEYEMDGTQATDFHRPLAAYINTVISLGCQVREIAEPGLDRQMAASGPGGVDAYVHLPNFLAVAAIKA